MNNHNEKPKGGAGSEGSDTGSIAQSSEGNSQGKLAISESSGSEGDMVDTSGDFGGFDSGGFGDF